MDITEKEFILKCAKFMGLKPYEFDNGRDIELVYNIEYEHRTGTLPVPDYYNDANSRNKVIEKMRIRSEFNYKSNDHLNEWCCIGGLSLHTMTHDKSMEAAQIACIEKVLENE